MYLTTLEEALSYLSGLGITQIPVEELAPFPTLPPQCLKCKRVTTGLTTSWANTNGNADRPYFKCLRCKVFYIFADTRGNNPDNPECERPCNCGASTKLIANRDGKERYFHLLYVCRRGTCTCRKTLCDDTNQKINVASELIDELARRNI
ncbi:uncharacterized protein F4812DRAFT_410127, partial [Daldinia caldariorum]|uniref:uncharacterized protein n=1 Tax=Daldinia caldariorum TaxID=326644 RepID=UPI00200740E5